MSDAAWRWALRSVTETADFPLVFQTFENLYEFCVSLLQLDGHEKLTAKQQKQMETASAEFIKFTQFLTREDNKYTPQNVRRLIGLAKTLLEWSEDTHYFEHPKAVQEQLLKESPLHAINNIGLAL